MDRIYLDHNATTALDPRVFKAMLVDLSGPPANPSSPHWFGQKARAHLQKARQTLATYFSAKPEEIIFTSGGTESVNLFLRGLGTHGHIITTAIEHSCVYRTIQSLEAQGLKVTYLPVGLWGAPLAQDCEAALRPDTRAIVICAANTETGVKPDLEAFATLAETHKIPLFVDAVAYIGKEPWVDYPGITAVALSGHKFHAPKGIGALFCRSSLKLIPTATGGAQEFQHRAGTENLAGILGLAEAFQILLESQQAITQHLTDLRHHFEFELRKALPQILINGEGPRVSNVSNVAFPGMDGETFLIQLDLNGIAASHGSACASGAMEPSRVLTQMGIPRKIACASLRFSFGRTTTREELDRAIPLIARLYTRLLNPRERT